MEFSENMIKIIFTIILFICSGKLLQYLFMNTNSSPSPMSMYLQANYMKIGAAFMILVIMVGILRFIEWDFTTDENTTLESKYVIEGYNSASGADTNQHTHTHEHTHTGTDTSRNSSGTTASGTTASGTTTSGTASGNDVNYSSYNLSPENFWRTKGLGFCEAIKTDINKHKAACKTLSFENCSQFVNCCAAVNGFDEKNYNCVPTSSTGTPLFTEDNVGQNIDFYWYKGKCQGNTCNLNGEQKNNWIKTRSNFVKNYTENKEIINETNEEIKKQEDNNGRSCKLWGTN